MTILVNEPHHVIGAAIGEFYRSCAREDLALLYFTGHGLKDDTGKLYFASTNTARHNLVFTSVGAAQIHDAVDACRSRWKVLVLDCCYSGAFPAGVTAKGDPEVHALERFQGRGRVVLTASDSTQYSFEGDALTGGSAGSVFTRHLVEAVRTGAADLDGDGDVSLDELYEYVRERVIAEMPQQRPKLQQDVDGRIVISRNLGWTLPGHVRAALDSPIPAQRRGALDELVRLHRIGNPSVRAQVLREVDALAEDDSRSVSAAAAEARTRLRGGDPRAEEAHPEAEPERSRSESPQRATTRPESPRAEVVAEPAPEPPRPALQEAEPPRLRDPNTAEQVGTHRAAAKQSPAEGPSAGASPARAGIAGMLVVLVVIGILPFSTTGSASATALESLGAALWYIGFAGPAALALLLCLPVVPVQFTAGAAGGLGIGVAAFLLPYSIYQIGSATGIGVGYLGLWVVALALVVLAVTALRREAGWSPPTGGVSWVVVAAGLAFVVGTIVYSIVRWTGYPQYVVGEAVQPVVVGVAAVLLTAGTLRPAQRTAGLIAITTATLPALGYFVSYALSGSAQDVLLPTLISVAFLGVVALRHRFPTRVT